MTWIIQTYISLNFGPVVVDTCSVYLVVPQFVHCAIDCILLSLQSGTTPLHIACARSSLDVVQQLLSVSGIDVNIRDERNQTPVMCARDYRILALLKKYMKSCEDFPVHSVTKVVLCGNTGAGKTTLAQVRFIDF